MLPCSGQTVRTWSFVRGLKTNGCWADLLHSSLISRLLSTPKHSKSHLKITLKDSHFSRVSQPQWSLFWNQQARERCMTQVTIPTWACRRALEAQEHRFTGVWPPEAPSSVTGKQVAEGRSFEGSSKKSHSAPVSEGWDRRTDIWPFKISVWDFKLQLSFEPKAFWEKITRQKAETGWASSEKLSPLHLKQRDRRSLQNDLLGGNYSKERLLFDLTFPLLFFFFLTFWVTVVIKSPVNEREWSLPVTHAFTQTYTCIHSDLHTHSLRLTHAFTHTYTCVHSYLHMH